MRITYNQIKELLIDFRWSPAELAEKLSLAGHETELIDGDQLDITLTANRHDCQDLAHLVFDFAGVYGFKTIPNLISFNHKEPIKVTVEQINRLLGSNLAANDLKQLERLGFIVKNSAVVPPDFRDVETVADVAEEIMRQIGYDKLKIHSLSEQNVASSNLYQHLLAIKSALVQIGLTETATSSFTHSGIVEVNDPSSRDEPFLRPNLLLGLLKTLARNPYLKRVAFFEVGNVFTPNEITKLGVIIAGYKDNIMREKIIETLGQSIQFVNVDPAQAVSLDVKQSHLCYFELSIDNLQPAFVTNRDRLELSLPQYKTISKFPPLIRDITIDQTGERYDEALKFFQSSNDLLFFEVIDEYQKRVTFRLLFQKMSGSYLKEEIKTIDETLKRFQNV